MVKYWKKNISWNIEAVFFKLQKKCPSQKKQNDAHSVITVATLLAPVSFHQKLNTLIFNPSKWDRGSYLKQTWFWYCLNSHHYRCGYTHHGKMAFPKVNFPVVHHTWVLISRGSSGYTRKAISQGKTNVTQMWREIEYSNFLSHHDGVWFERIGPLQPSHHVTCFS